MRCLRLSLLGVVLTLLVAQPALASFRGRNGLLAVQTLHGGSVVLIGRGARVKRTVCTRAQPCRPTRTFSLSWSSDGRYLAIAGHGGTTILAADGSCVDCQGLSMGSAAFTTDPAELTGITGITGAKLIPSGIDGIWSGPPLAVGAGAAAWSSTGLLAVVEHREVWAGPPNRLRDLGPGRAPSWAPSGDRLALARGGWITVEDVASGTARRLVRGSSPAWAPDGRSIAFLEPGGRLAEIGPAGGRPRIIGRIRGSLVAWQPTLASSPPCLAPPGSFVLARSTSGIVTQTGSDAEFGVTDGPTAVMGCLFANGQERLLARDSFQSIDVEVGFDGAATAGDYAAVGVFASDIHYGGASSALTVYDLRTGVSAGKLGGEQIQCTDHSCTTGIDDIVVNSSGDSAAHLSASDGCTAYVIGGAGCEEIAVSDSAGPRVVDTAVGSSADGQWPPNEPPVLANLALDGDTLTWTHDGAPRNTTLH